MQGAAAQQEQEAALQEAQVCITVRRYLNSRPQAATLRLKLMCQATALSVSIRVDVRQACNETSGCKTGVSQLGLLILGFVMVTAGFLILQLQ